MGLALSLLLMPLAACGDGGPAGIDRPDGNGVVAGDDGPTELLAGTLVLEYSFADFSPDRLILDGFEYERLA